MCKKLLIAAIAVVVGLTVVKKTELGSWVGVWWKHARECAREQVAPETEIEALRLRLDQLGEDSKKNFDAVARERVAVKNLREEIATGEASLAREKKNVLGLREDLASATDGYVKVGVTKYPKSRVKSQLARSFELYKVAEEQLKSKRQLLQAKEESLTAAEEQLASLQNTRDELTVELAKLEAEMKTVRVAQTKSKVQFDDSELARIKEGVARVRNRIKVEQEKLAVQAQFGTDPIPTSDRVQEKDLLKDIDSHFGKTEPHKVAHGK